MTPFTCCFLVTKLPIICVQHQINVSSLMTLEIQPTIGWLYYFSLSTWERGGLTTILLDFTRVLRQHYYSQMGHFVWDSEKKYIVGKNKVSKNIVAQQSSMNKTSKLPTLTHWSGNIGHEKVLKLSPGFTIFDLNMRKLGRLGTKTKHKDLSNLSSR